MTDYVAIIADFLSDEHSDATVLDTLEIQYGATNVAAALRAELRAAREFCRERERLGSEIIDVQMRQRLPEFTNHTNCKPIECLVPPVPPVLGRPRTV